MTSRHMLPARGLRYHLFFFVFFFFFSFFFVVSIFARQVKVGVAELHTWKKHGSCCLEGI